MFACVGLGELSKHTMAFFAMAFALWLFTDRRQWPLLRDWRFYAGCLVSLVLISPMLIWNAQNNWDGVTAILYLRSSLGSSGGMETAANYLVGQLLTFSPLWLIVFVGLTITVAIRQISARIWPAVRSRAQQLMARFTKKETDKTRAAAANATPTAPEIRLLWFNALILPVFFLYLSASREIQGNWTFASYPAAVLLLVQALPADWQSASMKARIAIVTFAIGSVFTLALDTLAYFSVPIVKALGIKVESYFVPGYRPVGFAEAAQAAARHRDEQLPGAGLAAANRYQDAAIASWHLPGQPFIPSINVMQRNQYNYWPGLERGRDYIVFYIHEKTCERSEVLLAPMLGFMFEDVEELSEQDVLVDGVAVKRYQLFVARNYRRSWEDIVYNYFVRRSIQDMMPNLRGYYSEVDTKQGQADAMLKLQQMRNSRLGGSGCGILGSL